MTATQIIAEIGALPPQEKQRVIRFARELEAETPLSGEQLSLLAEKLANAKDTDQAAALNVEIIKGFYGSK